MKPLNLRANGGKNTKNNSWAKMTFASAFSLTCNISSALAPLSRTNSLTQHFFHIKIKNLPWNRWIYEQMVEKHQKLLLRNNAIGKCLHTHMQHFFRPSPAIVKKFAESSFFHTKIKTCQETVEFTSKWGKSTKNYSWATMPLASAFRPTCKISSALAPLSRKNWLNQRIEHFFIQKSKTCHETVEFRSQWGQNTKNYSWATMPIRKCLQAHMQHFFSPSPAIEKKFVESAFFHTKIKNLSWNRWIYEQMVEKHKKLLLRNNAPRKCLQAHMKHFFSPSPAIDKKFAESAFFHTKIKYLSWNRWIYEQMGGKTPKTTPAQKCPSQVPSGPHATFLQP